LQFRQESWLATGQIVQGLDPDADALIKRESAPERLETEDGGTIFINKIGREFKEKKVGGVLQGLGSSFQGLGFKIRDKGFRF
jgi:hypothetical protein